MTMLRCAAVAGLFLAASAFTTVQAPAGPAPVAASPGPAVPAVSMISGTIVSATNATIVLQSGYSNPSPYKIGPNANVLLDGKSASMTALKTGYPANLTIAGGTVVAIYARTPSRDSWGNITQLEPSSITLASTAGDQYQYTLLPATTVTIYGKPANLIDMKTGMYAHVVYGDDGTAKSVEIVRRDNQTFRGKISDISPKSITLQPVKGDPTTLAINASTTISADGKAATVSALRKGAMAEATSADGAAAATITLITASGAHGKGAAGGHPGGQAPQGGRPQGASAPGMP